MGGWIVFALALAVSAAPSAPPPIISPPPLVQMRTPERPPTRTIGTFENWRVDDEGDFIEAFTGNESGSQFGVLCGTTCVIYISNGIGCENAHYYPAMLNSHAGSEHLNLRCVVISEQLRVLVVENQIDIAGVLSGGGEIGFAIPLQSGQFSVSRFSLNGGIQAAGLAARTAQQRQGQQQQGLRDFTI